MPVVPVHTRTGALAMGAPLPSRATRRYPIDCPTSTLGASKRARNDGSPGVSSRAASRTDATLARTSGTSATRSHDQVGSSLGGMGMVTMARPDASETASMTCLA